MNQEHYKNQNVQSYDVKYISRCLMRNALFILMFACLAGVFSYIFWITIRRILTRQVSISM